MRLFRFLHKEKSFPAWTYHTEGVIWRVVPTESGKILGEERDVTKKATSFFCLSHMGEVLWEKRHFGNHWWVGIECVHRDVAFLHEFASPDLPEHRCMIAVDLLSGSPLWSNSELRFVGARDECVYGARDSAEGSRILELDYRTGAILRSLGSDDHILRERQAEEDLPWEEEVKLPLPVLGSEYEEVSPTLRGHLDADRIEGPLEVVKGDEIMVFSYHEKVPADRQGGPRYHHRLKAVHKSSGAEIHTETLNRNVSSIAPEGFFVRRNVLYYVKERNTLTAVRLAPRDSAEDETQ